MRSRTIPRAIVSARSGAPRRRWTRVVAFALATYAGALVAALVFNAVIDPFGFSGAGLFPPAVEHDRSAKLRLLEDLDDSPDILVLGSSRARIAEPAVLERLTGHDGFNAAVTAGAASDAWVMVRYAADRFPGEPRRYVWFVDVGIGSDVVNPQLAADRRARKYLDGGPSRSWPDPDHLAQYISLETTRISLRVLRACVFESCRSPIEYLADGAVVPTSDRALPEHAPSLRQSVERHLADVRSRGVVTRVPPLRRRIWFERVLEFMNSQGARPVLVLNAIHPAVLRELERRGFDKRKEATLRYLRSLERRFDFVVVDCQRISDWGGSAREFFDSNHLNRTNMRRLLAYVVEHSDGALD